MNRLKRRSLANGIRLVYCSLQSVLIQEVEDSADLASGRCHVDPCHATPDATCPNLCHLARWRRISRPARAVSANQQLTSHHRHRNAMPWVGFARPGGGCEMASLDRKQVP